MKNEKLNNTFTERLRAGELLVGTMLTIPAPEVAEMVSKCGFDWLFMDGEHSPHSTLDWQRMIQAVAGRCASVIRVALGEEIEIKKALDIGADGIIAPQINTAEQARRIVDWCKYPPDGTRGVGLARAHGYGIDFAEYVKNANSDIAVIVQAEHIDAVHNIESIAAVEGIDAVFVGPYDLSASMGKIGQVDDPEVVDAIDKVANACRRAEMPLGFFGVSPAAVRPYIDKGYKLICTGVDAGLLVGSAVALLEELNGQGIE
jgi:2-dehydro-3-deoxyglucarate aldolase